MTKTHNDAIGVRLASDTPRMPGENRTLAATERRAAAAPPTVGT